ncbi:MAG: TIGR00730 family Rossman fold protein [Campylobacterota bacterium]|nr:TIGR00730 family Rossman fold protein [Campylobacterota bacterium]
MKNREHELTKKYIKDIKSADVWSVFRIIADFVKGFDDLGELGPTVTIFGSARSSSEEFYYKEALKLSEMLAKRGFNIMSGGGPGIMEAANRGAAKVEGIESIGLNVDFPFEQIANPYTTKELTFDYFFSRKVMLVKYSMAYVIFPGGYGTLDELFEALTLIQTRKVTGVKIFVIGVDFYKPLIEFIENKLMTKGMIDENDIALIRLTDDLECVVNEIEESLVKQIEVLKDVGLSDTSYYRSLSDFSYDKDIIQDRRVNDSKKRREKDEE